METAKDPDANDRPRLEPSEDNFRHQALDPEKSEIRLCRFTNPAETSEKLTATLETFELHHSPPYTALSYEWGDSTGNANVLLGGASLGVRQNLANFLTVLLGLDFHGTYLWIDQICIDQASMVERNHQVRLMSDIYSNAEEVIAWIGLTLPDPRRRQLKSNSELVFAPYWRRLWIAQELLLARKIRVCGVSGIVDWEQIVSWVLPRGLPSPRKLSAFFGDEWKEFWWAESGPAFKFWNFIFLRHMDTIALPLPLVQAINKFSESECSDPRDKVYGLLGLVVPEERIEPDYSITPRALMYKALAKVLSVNKAPVQTPDHLVGVIFRLFALRIGLRRTEWRRIDHFMAAYRSREHRITKSQTRTQKSSKVGRHRVR
ncbi:heterokaryon incompatibility protein-domain-containing protein [Lophiotrema nucula]|uniref:Heterokaryon incompatibility protein-domain-containing protein n=1 Tax=Lophiotrema nucula TaxID=690887 RepID=A0A6A5YWX9_9PLEO|nr:heterokaryon incompatibility protein-domain-containing protein [Lophiotrema nucula]